MKSAIRIEPLETRTAPAVAIAILPCCDVAEVDVTVAGRNVYACVS